MANNHPAHLDPKAAEIFRRLVSTPTGELIKEAREIDTGGAGIMAVHVDRLADTALGAVFSIAHYYKQNGDLICDPDVTFLVNGGTIVPLTFEQGGLLYHVAAEVVGTTIEFKPRALRDLRAFANQWMRTIEDQQDLNMIGVLDGTAPAADARLIEAIEGKGGAL